MSRTGSGVEVREKAIRLSFVLDGRPQKHTLRVNGKAMLPTPANVKYAHRLAAEIRERIRHGTFSLAEYFPAAGTGAAPTTVAVQLNTWLAGQRIEASTRAGYESAVRFWIAAPYNDAGAPLGDVGLRLLKLSLILGVIARRPELSGKTINNYVSVLRQALELAVDDGLLTENPAEKVPRAKHQKEPPDPFTLDEAERLITAMPEGQVRNMVEFWFRTGLRTSELAGLRWRNIDLASGVMVVREATVRGVEKDSTKTGVQRRVRLDNALPALLRQKVHTYLAGEHVFLDPRYGTPWNEERAFRRTYWTPTLKRLGIRYRRPYTMRHTRATEMLMKRVNPAFAAKQLGHSVEVFLRDYSRWLPGDADDAEMAKLLGSSPFSSTAKSAG